VGKVRSVGVTQCMQTLYLFRLSGSALTAAAARQIPRKPVWTTTTGKVRMSFFIFSQAPSPCWHPCRRSGGRVVRNICEDLAVFFGDIFVIVTRKIRATIRLGFDACSIRFKAIVLL